MQHTPDRTERTLRVTKLADFHRNPPHRNYLSLRQQWRLLLLVMSLGLVLLLMSEARDPTNWAWVAGSGEGGNASSSTLAPTEHPPAARRSPQNSPREGAPGEPAGRSTGEDSVDGYFPGVKPAYLDEVRDDTLFRYQEQDAWFHLFEILERTDEARLRRESIGRVTYGQLFRQSGQYRGQLVTVRGTIRRTSLPPVAENDYGIDRYYRTVFQPDDNRSELMFVYCLYLPEGFPQGEEVSANVEVTGFYFKRWAYAAQDTVRTAPVLVARTVRWYRPAPAAEQRRVGFGTVLTSVAVALGASLVVVVYVYRRTRRTPPHRPAAPPQFEALRDVPTASGPRLPWETADRQEPKT
jgi:hypothetical protein